MASRILEALRLATAPSHARLEANSRLVERLGNPASRPQAVAALHAFQAGAEAALAPSLAGLEGLNFDHRRRAARMRLDLACLGAPQRPGGFAFPTPRSLGEALGMFYVVEGQALGARIIRRRIQAAGGCLQGLSFLDLHGDEIGALWRGLTETLDLAAEQAFADIVRGGELGFAAAEAWLTPAEATA